MYRFGIEIRWGIVFSIAIVAWTALERVLGLHDVHLEQHATYTWLFAIVAISIYLAALYQRRNALEQVMSWKDGFKSGMVLTMVVVLLSPLTQWVIHTLISPTYLENLRAYVVMHNLATPEQAQAHYTLRSYIMMSILSTLAMGTLTSAVSALIMRKGGTRSSDASND